MSQSKDSAMIRLACGETVSDAEKARRNLSFLPVVRLWRASGAMIEG
jgi:hypothetical protein